MKPAFRPELAYDRNGGLVVPWREPALQSPGVGLRLRRGHAGSSPCVGSGALRLGRG
ncbi:hypothetical protein [Cyclobacterium xiamenense]|uniref:hypothetical protein n=1 Tax=Cyclobacterium xiamenense TaxID=1297121 RepID=UPI0012B74348|nr:hypothetical protein [Cyclobacterium xiamenense]